MQTQTQTQVRVRWMIRRDMDAVLAIEDQSFEFPWLEEDFIRCLRQRNCIGKVATYDDLATESERVVGFMVFQLRIRCFRLLNFAVAPEFRRQGVGSQMVATLACRLARDRRRRIVSEVRESNLAAQLFFRAIGFRAIGVKRGRYRETAEDAYRFVLRWTPTAAAVNVRCKVRGKG